jgi:hypothetical protein
VQRPDEFRREPSVVAGQFLGSRLAIFDHIEPLRGDGSWLGE